MNLIKLANYLEAKYSSEAPKNGPFNEYLWPKYREGIKEIEPESKLEKLVYKHIKQHFSSKHVGLPLKTVKLLIKCLENNWYSKVLHAPKHKTLYRGLLLNKKDLSKLINKEPLDKEKIEYNNSIKVDNGHSTSWTYKKNISKDFSGNYGKAKQGYIVTLIANLEDNKNRFLSGPGGLYDVEGLSKWHLEKESIGLEPIQIKYIEYEKI